MGGQQTVGTGVVLLARFPLRNAKAIVSGRVVRIM